MKLAEDDFSGVEIRFTPMCTKIINDSSLEPLRPKMFGSDFFDTLVLLLVVL
jgi:hypothetical protein